MAKRAPKGAKRKLVNVDLDYISLVEKPANQTQFQVIKSEDGSVRTEGVNREVLIYKASDGPFATIDVVDGLPNTADKKTVTEWFMGMLKSVLGGGATDVADPGADPEVVTKNEIMDAALSAVETSCEGLTPVSKEEQMSGPVDAATYDQIKKDFAEKGFDIEKIMGVSKPWMASGGKHAANIGRTNYAYKAVLEGITKDSTAIDVVERFADVVAGLSGLAKGDVEKKKDEDDKAYGNRKKQAEALIDTVKGSIMKLLEAVPEELHVLRTVPSQGAGPDQSAGAGAHQDATKTGGAGNAIDPATEDAMKRQFTDLLREQKEKFEATIATLTKSVEDLGGQTRPSTLTSGDEPTNVSKSQPDDDGKFIFPVDMAGGDVEKSLEKVEKAIAEAKT